VNPYLELTREFNRGSLRAIVSSGQLARLLVEPREQLLASRSAEDLVELAARHLQVARELVERRPLLQHAAAGNRPELQRALDAERRSLMAADVARLQRYATAAAAWAAAWPELQRELAGRPLEAQHERMVAAAVDLLPFEPGP
jgi:hypothetical protein